MQVGPIADYTMWFKVCNGMFACCRSFMRCVKDYFMPSAITWTISLISSRIGRAVLRPISYSTSTCPMLCQNTCNMRAHSSLPLCPQRCSNSSWQTCFPGFCGTGMLLCSATQRYSSRTISNVRSSILLHSCQHCLWHLSAAACSNLWLQYMPCTQVHLAPYC